MVRTTALLLAVLVLCGGCLAADPPDSPTAGTTGATATFTTGTTNPTPPTTTATATTETPSYNDCPYLLSVEVAGENPDTRGETVVEYSNLAEPRRAEFDRALEERTVELGEEPNGWVERRFVRKDGVLYRAGVMIC